MNNETRLLQDLFRGYDMNARPVLNNSDSVKVSLNFQIIRIIELVCVWEDLSRWPFEHPKSLHSESFTLPTPDLELQSLNSFYAPRLKTSLSQIINRPFPSCLLILFQKET